MGPDGRVHKRIGEVQYYFRVRSQDPRQLETHALAVLSVWSLPHEDLWERSSHTCYSSIYRGQRSLVVVDVHDILTVVGMVAHHVAGEARFFLVEKPGLGLISYNGLDAEPQAEDQGDGEYWEDYW